MKRNREDDLNSQVTDSGSASTASFEKRKNLKTGRNFAGKPKKREIKKTVKRISRRKKLELNLPGRVRLAPFVPRKNMKKRDFFTTDGPYCPVIAYSEGTFNMAAIRAGALKQREIESNFQWGQTYLSRFYWIPVEAKSYQKLIS